MPVLHGSLEGAAPAEPRWAQVIDIEILRKVTEVILPGLACAGWAVDPADAPAGFHRAPSPTGPCSNAAAVLLSCYGKSPRNARRG